MLFAAAGNPLPRREPAKGEPGFVPYRERWRQFTREHNVLFKQKAKAARARRSPKPPDAG